MGKRLVVCCDGTWNFADQPRGIPPPDAEMLRPAGDRFNHRWAFHDTESSSWVVAAFQALAVDEQRSAFRPALRHQQPAAAQQGQEHWAIAPDAGWERTGSPGRCTARPGGR